jgi:hypothetical protein
MKRGNHRNELGRDLVCSESERIAKACSIIDDLVEPVVPVVQEQVVTCVATSVDCNRFILISAGRPDEAGFARRIIENYEDLVLPNSVFTFEHHDVQTAAEFRSVCADLALKASAGARPLVHLNMHGHLELGVEIGASRELIGWPAIARLLRLINSATNNNLVVLATVCFGMHQIKEFSINELTPVCVMLAPESEIAFGEIESGLSEFLKEVQRAGDLGAAREKLPPALKYWHCERMLVIAFDKYYKKHCRGKGLEIRREELLTKALSGNVANNRTNRRWARKVIKKTVSPDEAQFLRLARRFLGSRKLSVTWPEVLEHVKSTALAPE